MTACCPVCKGPLPTPLPHVVVEAGGARARVSRAQGIVLAALVEAGAQGLGREDMLDALRTGFPDAGVDAVDVHLRRLRRKLKPLGVRILPVPGSHRPAMRTGRGGSCGTRRFALDAPVRVVAAGEEQT